MWAITGRRLARADSAYAIDLAFHPARFGVRDEAMSTVRPGCLPRIYVWRDDDQTLHDTGMSDGNPGPTPTAETWLECIVATERSAAGAAGQALHSNPGPAGQSQSRDGVNHYNHMMDLHRQRMDGALPSLTNDEIAERRRVYEGRNDEPAELERAQWRGDCCNVALGADADPDA